MINNVTNATIVRNGYTVSEEIATKGIIIIKNILNYFFNSIQKKQWPKMFCSSLPRFF